MAVLKFCCPFCDLDFVHSNFKVIQYLRLSIGLKLVLSQFSEILLPLCNPATPSLVVSCWHWPWSLTYFSKTLTFAISFKPEEVRLSSCDCVTLRVLKYFLSTFPLCIVYTSLPHDLIQTEVWSLVNWCFNRDLKTCLCTSDKAGFFSNKMYDSNKCWTCAELCES